MDRVSTGTTILALKCSDGVILAADSRASAGSYIVIREMSKITAVAPSIYVCHSGTASATQCLDRMVRYYLNAHAIWTPDSVRPKVGIAAQVLRKLLQNNKDILSAQMIVAGVDDEGGHVYAVMQSGMGIAREFAAGGSGSTYLTAYFDEYFRAGMTLVEAEEWALTAITYATVRDGFSGGPIQVVRIGKDGASAKWYTPDKQPFDMSIVKT
jgi:20S proteasome alpha/beta subunit